MSLTRERLNAYLQARDPNALLGSRPVPHHWDEWSDAQKFEHIADRMLAEDRSGTTNHFEIKETGILSRYQMQRRLEREVYANHTAGGDLGTVKHGSLSGQGQFSKPYVRSKLATGTSRPDDD